MDLGLGFAGVYGAGLLTFVTPCVLPLIPIYLALLGNSMGQQGRGAASRFSLFFNTLMFALGLELVFVPLGLTATSLGATLTEHRTQLVLVGGLVIFLFGLKFLGVLKIGFLDREKRLDDTKLKSRYQLVNSLVMGLVFALGWTPCVGPVLGSVLVYTASATSDPLVGAQYLALYGLGFATPLLVLSLFGDAARQIVRKITPHLPLIEKISGGAVAAVGLYLMLSVTSAPTGELSPPGAVPSAGQHVVSVSPKLGQPTDRPRMVQFTSPRCSICRQMIPTVAVIERDCDGRKVDVVKVSVDKNRKLATSYRVRGVPTFVFLDKGGTEIARLVGYQTLASLRQSLSAVTGRKCDGLGGFKPEPQPQSKPTGTTPKRTPQPNTACDSKPGTSPFGAKKAGSQCDS
jgi:cytochrome c-type biogenesis protein